MLDSNILNFAKAGDLAQLQVSLADFDYDLVAQKTHYFEYPEEALELIRTAANAHQIRTLRWLIDERFPGWHPHLRTHMAAISAGPEVYDVFLSKWPDLMNTDLGHNGNPLGYSVFSCDKAMVEYLLDKGADPNYAHYSGLEVGCGVLGGRADI